MTQKKQLLFKDLCARLPYGVICKLSAKGANISITEKLDLGGLEHFIFGTIDVLPYLRPMSSMTEEEENEYRAINCYEGLFPRNEDALDYVLEHHFDYRGMIEKGLALEAPEEMYKEEKKLQQKTF